MVMQSADQLPFSVLIIAVQDDPGSIVYANGALLDMADCDSLGELRSYTGNDYRALISRESWYELPTSLPSSLVGLRQTSSR